MLFAENSHPYLSLTNNNIPMTTAIFLLIISCKEQNAGKRSRLPTPDRHRVELCFYLKCVQLNALVLCSYHINSFRISKTISAIL